MKILQFNAENVKKLTVVQIKPDGNIVQLTGRNGSGKTSVLDSILWAMAGTEAIQSKPIRKGAETARIELALGIGGTTKLIVERRFTEHQSYLTVKSVDGAKYPSPQRMLDDLLGTLTFDPLGFMREKPREQFETLRKLVKLDIDPDALDEANVTDAAKRTDINRDTKTLRARIGAIPPTPEELPAAPIDEAGLLDRVETAAAGNVAIEQRKARRADHVHNIAGIRREALEDLEHARALTAAAEQKNAKADKMQAELNAAPPLAEPIDITALRIALTAARETNRHIAVRTQRAQLESEAEAMQKRADGLTAAMDARKAAKRAAIEKAEMPIPGLGMGEGEVLFNGVPLNQASDAEQLMVSTAIAAALNPKLRVLRIRDGSLLDDDAMKRLAEFADKHDMQIWVERVTSSGNVGIVMEDGHVRGQEPPVEEAAAAE